MKSGLLVAADLYGCAEDALVQEALKKVLEDYAEKNSMHMQSIRVEQENETSYGIYSICKAGHIILHVNMEKGFVAIDGFSCSEDADPEKMVRELCSFLSPDKMKLTYVDRGDFGKKADTEPDSNARLFIIGLYDGIKEKVLSNAMFCCVSSRGNS